MSHLIALEVRHIRCIDAFVGHRPGNTKPVIVMLSDNRQWHYMDTLTFWAKVGWSTGGGNIFEAVKTLIGTDI